MNTSGKVWNLAAFTLLEAVVSVAIFGLLMVAVGALWTTCWRATERIAQHDGAEANPRLVLKRLGEAAEASVFHPLPKRLYAWQSEAGHGGGSDRVSFVTTLPPDAAEASAKTGPPERIRIRVRTEGGEKGRLVMQAAPFTMAEDDWQRETVLLENVAAFDVRYWNNLNQEWENHWRDDERPPAAVQFVISQPSETRSDAGAWPNAWTARVPVPVDMVQAVSAAQAGAKTIDGGGGGK